MTDWKPWFRILILAGLILPGLLAVRPVVYASPLALPVDRWQRHIIDSNRPWRAVFIDVGDIDGDGLPDIVTGGWWYRNPGAAGESWVRHAIGGKLYNMAVVHDLDGDGDLDILGTKGRETSSDFLWAENQGDGAFSIHANIPAGTGDFLQGARAAQIIPGGNPEVVLSWHKLTNTTQMFRIPSPATGDWSWKAISSTTNNEQIAIGDIDGDRDLDIHLGTSWLRNDGSTWATFTAFALGDPNAGPDRVEMADIDGDGDLDVVVGAEGANRVVWAEAPPDPGDPWTEHVISTDIPGMSLDVGDIDQDGDPDLVVGEHNTRDPLSGRVIIYQNQGKGVSWKAVQIDTGLEHHAGTQLFDIDNDGDLDILSIGWLHDQVVLYENKAVQAVPSRGRPQATTVGSRATDAAAPTIGRTPGAVPTSSSSTRNTEVPGSILARRPTAPEWTHLSSRNGDLPVPGTATEQTAALILDVDRNGVNDLVVASRRGGSSLVWYRRGDARWTHYLLEAETLDIEAGGTFFDIDGDLDLDIVMGGDNSSSQIWWWENPYPDYEQDVPWVRRAIKNSGKTKHHDLVFGDFDGDGRRELAFWNQRAKGLFLAEIPVDPKNTEPWPYAQIFAWRGTGSYEGLTKADINGDGKIDLVGAGRWFEHIGNTDYAVHVIDDSQTFARVAATQLVAGGWPEVILVPGDSVGRLRWYEWTGSVWRGHDLLAFDADHAHSLEVGDINGDGHVDLFCAEMRLDGGNPDAKMWVFLGDGQGSFAKTEVATGYDNHESKLGDLDGDGDVDILGKPYNWDTPGIDIWLNGGSGTPVPTNTPAAAPKPTGTPPPAPLVTAAPSGGAPAGGGAAVAIPIAPLPDLHAPTGTPRATPMADGDPCAPSATNLLANPGFETGTYPWVFYTRGQGRLTASGPAYECSAAARVQIDTVSTKIQLQQSGLALKSGARYRLRVAASSSLGDNVRVYVHKGAPSYTSYGLDGAELDLSSSWREYSVEFTAKGFAGTVHDGRLRFWFAGEAQAGEVYWFDAVTLEEVSGLSPIAPAR